MNQDVQNFKGVPFLGHKNKTPPSTPPPDVQKHEPYLFWGGIKSEEEGQSMHQGKWSMFLSLKLPDIQLVVAYSFAYMRQLDCTRVFCWFMWSTSRNRCLFLSTLNEIICWFVIFAGKNGTACKNKNLLANPAVNVFCKGHLLKHSYFNRLLDIVCISLKVLIQCKSHRIIWKSESLLRVKGHLSSCPTESLSRCNGFTQTWGSPIAGASTCWAFSVVQASEGG